MTTSLTIGSRDGLSLEAAIDERGSPRAGLVICHPHPRMGGTMEAPLLLALRDVLVGRDWSVLRFNFRGVGASEGQSATGEAEVADAAGALDAMKEHLPGKPVAVAGWSFGGAVAVRAAVREEIDACVAIAPAVVAKEDVAAGLPSTLRVDKPLLVVIGTNDDQIPADLVQEWASTQPRVELVTIPGANHFFWAKYEELTAVIAEWLEGVV